MQEFAQPEMVRMPNGNPAVSIVGLRRWSVLTVVKAKQSWNEGWILSTYRRINRVQSLHFGFKTNFREVVKDIITGSFLMLISDLITKYKCQTWRFEAERGLHDPVYKWLKPSKMFETFHSDKG